MLIFDFENIIYFLDFLRKEKVPSIEKIQTITRVLRPLKNVY